MMIKMNLFKGMVLLSILTLNSCLNHKLSEKELIWQPYKQGDILIFQSNTKNIDTIWVNELNTYSNPEDNLSPTSDYNEILFIKGEISIPKSLVIENQNRASITLLKVTASKESNIRLMLNKRYDSISYPEISFKTKDLTNEFDKKSQVVFGPNDIIEIDGEDISGFLSDVETIWWSKTLGYIRYNYKDKSFWELKQFLRNGEDLLGNK